MHPWGGGSLFFFPSKTSTNVSEGVDFINYFSNDRRILVEAGEKMSDSTHGTDARATAAVGTSGVSPPTHPKSHAN